MKNQKSSTLFFIAGGSGGHILPALRLAKECKEHNSDVSLIFFITNKKIDQTVIENADWVSRFVYTPHCKIPSSFFSFSIFQFLYSFAGLLYKAFAAFIKKVPDKVVTTGGFSALPFCYIAHLCGVPIELYELNSTPGRASSVIARWATTVYVTFDSCKKFFPAQTVSIPYPHRFSIQDTMLSRQTAVTIVQEWNRNFFLDKKTILIIGGSQGSAYLNTLFKGWIERSCRTPSLIQVIHQVGAEDCDEWRGWYAMQGITAYVFSYSHEMAPLYVIADIVITRAGAGILFELEFFKKRSIIIPLKTQATSHQYANAYEMAMRNPAIFSVQEPYCFEFDIGELNSKLEQLLA